MGARGEGVLCVAEREIRVLFTNRALARAETALGKTVLEIANDARSTRLGLNDTAKLLQAGMEAARRETGPGGKPSSLDEAFDVMDAVGFTETARVIIEALAAVLGYSSDKGEDGRPPE